MEIMIPEGNKSKHLQRTTRLSFTISIYANQSIIPTKVFISDTYPYNNKFGHSKGGKKGLNIVDDAGLRNVPDIVHLWRLRLHLF